MFNGIIRQRGHVRALQRQADRLHLEISAPGLFRSLKIGDSVAVNGVCLTAVRKGTRGFRFDVVSETQQRTTLGDLTVGQAVNLERPLRWMERVSGHFVLGHVDGVGTVDRVERSRSETRFLIRFPRTLKRFIVEKGSIAVDGVSLTLGRVRGNAFWVHIIPHTLGATCWKDRTSGSRVNLEVDYLAKLAIS